MQAQLLAAGNVARTAPHDDGIIEVLSEVEHALRQSEQHSECIVHSKMAGGGAEKAFNITKQPVAVAAAGAASKATVAVAEHCSSHIDIHFQPIFWQKLQELWNIRGGLMTVDATMGSWMKAVMAPTAADP